MAIKWHFFIFTHKVNAKNLAVKCQRGFRKRDSWRRGWDRLQRGLGRLNEGEWEEHFYGLCFPFSCDVKYFQRRHFYLYTKINVYECTICIYIYIYSWWQTMRDNSTTEPQQQQKKQQQQQQHLTAVVACFLVALWFLLCLFPLTKYIFVSIGIYNR